MDIYGSDSFTLLDTVRTPFSLRASFETEIADAGLSLGLIQQAYATSCEYQYLNKLDISTLEITCDKAFQYDGNSIAAGENFSDISTLDIQSFEFYNAELEILFPQAFLDNAVFESADHTFTLSVKTSNDLSLNNDASAYIDL